MSYPKNENSKMKILTINAPLRDIKLVDGWVNHGLTASRSEFIRNAIRNELGRIARLEEIISEEMSDAIGYFTPLQPPQPTPKIKIGEIREIDRMLMEYTEFGWKKIAHLKPL